jgi:hypothetical protein
MDTKDTKEIPMVLTLVSLVSFVLNSTRDTKIGYRGTDAAGCGSGVLDRPSVRSTM